MVGICMEERYMRMFCMRGANLQYESYAGGRTRVVRTLNWWWANFAATPGANR